MLVRIRVSIVTALLLAAGCTTAAEARAPAIGPAGALLLIGGGLDDDARPVYERFVALAARAGAPRIVVATAASGDQDAEGGGKVEALRIWAPMVPVTVVRRETSTADSVAAIDAATALFFTGGDQKRIVARYRPGDAATDEWLAMQRLLARGGVIAGASAGLAMMGDVMILSGHSPAALALAPQVGPGMHLLSSLVTDSHFFERDRVGRLVAALEASDKRVGIGVGEDACVEFDVGRGELIGVTAGDSLLVDIGALQRDGLARRNVRARVLRQGERVPLQARLAQAPVAAPPPAGTVQAIPVVEPGQNRQLASWRLFARASRPGSAPAELAVDGWTIRAWPDGRGEIVFDIEPTAAARQ